LADWEFFGARITMMMSKTKLNLGNDQQMVSLLGAKLNNIIEIVTYFYTYLGLNAQKCVLLVFVTI
jgi:hypothetical protein